MPLLPIIRASLLCILHSTFNYYFGHVDVEHILIAKGPWGLEGQTTPEGASCLMLAAQKGHLAIVKALTSAGDKMLLHHDIITKDMPTSCISE